MDRKVSALEKLPEKLDSLMEHQRKITEKLGSIIDRVDNHSDMRTASSNEISASTVNSITDGSKF